MKSRAEIDARPPVILPVDEARYRLTLLVYEADQMHRKGQKLSANALRDLAAGCAEVLELEGR